MGQPEKRTVNHRYVHGLRHYGSSERGNQMQIVQGSSKYGEMSPKKDFFTEGQCSIRSPKARHEVALTGVAQRNSVGRLAIPHPRQSREQFFMDDNGSPVATKASFLRSSRELNFTPYKPQVQKISTGQLLSPASINRNIMSPIRASGADISKPN